MDVMIIGVDPGLSAGVAVLVNGHLAYTFQGPPDLAVDRIETTLKSSVDYPDCPVVIACEMYTQTGRGAMTHQPEAQQMIGVLARLAGRYGAKIELQAPADARRMAPDALLKHLGLWVTPKDLPPYRTPDGPVRPPDADDARMAMRHAVLHLARRYNTVYDRLLRNADAQH